MMKKTTKNLAFLLKDLVAVTAKSDCSISGLALDSRQIKAGDLFFAYPGTKVDGRDFIEAAIAKGASAIVLEGNVPYQKNKTIPIFAVENLADNIGTIAARFYDHPSRSLHIIGVTGTNGKTSCTHFIGQALKALGQPCGIIGTLGSGLYGHLSNPDLTTPDPITLQKMLAEFRDQGVQFVAMEVSSHSLVQGRVKGVEFEVAIFTNLTRDHLDYHGTMENYAAAKRLLFSQPGLQYAILNMDDEYGQAWLSEIEENLSVYTYSVKPLQLVAKYPQIHVRHAQFEDIGFTASIQTPWGDGLLHNPHLMGDFNLSNLLAVLTTLSILGVPMQELLAALTQIQGVPGRMEAVTKTKNKPLVVVDYAHTPDALKHVLGVLREHCQGQLWCIFGCGGDRDRGKRPLMGEIVEQLADQIVVTDDNPRTENARQIVADIMAGLQNPAKAVVEHNRRRAIAHAISCAHADDIILIAGKGHEAYQIIGDEKLPFSDVFEAQLVLNS